MNIAGFIVFERATDEQLAFLPLTVPIGATIEAFQAAGFDVGWTWKYKEDN